MTGHTNRIWRNSTHGTPQAAELREASEREEAARLDADGVRLALAGQLESELVRRFTHPEKLWNSCRAKHYTKRMCMSEQVRSSVNKNGRVKRNQTYIHSIDRVSLRVIL